MLSWRLSCSLGLLLWASAGSFVEGVSFEEDVRITLEQKMAIDKLRSRVKPYITEAFMKDDIYLIKWLRVANFDMSLAESKFIDNIKWRKENRMATIDQEDFSDVSEDYPISNSGFDKEGRPLFVAAAGEWDIRGGVVTGRDRRVFRYLYQMVEVMARNIRRYQQEGRNVTQAILIVDADQFNLVQHACVRCLMVIVEILQLYEDHYPGMADKIFLVNTPGSAHLVIDAAKQVLAKETRDAIRVYGTNKAQWKEVLQHYIDRKYLPVELGGTATRH